MAYLNYLIVFICINFAIGMVTGVDGSPLKVDVDDSECQPYKIYAIDVDDLDGDGDTTDLIRVAPEVDPIANNPFGVGDNIDSIDDVTGEMHRPTNSTEISDGVFEGTGEWFDSISEAASRGWKGMETMMNIVTGGYIMDIVEHTTLQCQLDSTAFLTTQDECDLQAPPDNVVPCENATYGLWIDPLDGADNAMWSTFKGGIQVIFGMLLVITIFYWITGRGHMLSS